jgi:hypothetical protein
MEAQTVDTLPPWPGPLSCGPPHPAADRAQNGGVDCDREKPRQHNCHGACTPRICGKSAGGSHRRDYRRRDIHRQNRAWLRRADEQEGAGGEVEKHTLLASVNEPKRSCHGVRKARAEVAASADCTESQMMAMFGLTNPKMPAHYIAQANREELSISGMQKIVAFDQSQSLDDFLQLPEANSARTPDGHGVVIPG